MGFAHAAEFVFWGSMVLIAYVYFGYPMLAVVRAALQMAAERQRDGHLGLHWPGYPVLVVDSRLGGVSGECKGRRPTTVTYPGRDLPLLIHWFGTGEAQATALGRRVQGHVRDERLADGSKQLQVTAHAALKHLEGQRIGGHDLDVADETIARPRDALDNGKRHDRDEADDPQSPIAHDASQRRLAAIAPEYGSDREWCGKIKRIGLVLDAHADANDQAEQDA
mgnify:CR=1 FL=1